MIKRIIVVLFSGLLFLGLFLHFYQQDLGANSASPIQSIPKDAVLVGKSKHFRELWKQLSQTNLMWQELLKTPYFLQLDSNGRLLDSLIFNNPELAGVFDEAALWASLHVLKDNKVEWLYAMPFSGEVQQLQQLTIDLQLVMNSPLQGEQTAIHTAQLPNYPKAVIHFALYKKVLLCSFSKTVLEAGLNQLDQEQGLINDPEFKEVYTTSGEHVDANVFIQYSQLNKLIASLMKKKEQQNFQSFKHYAGWSALDMTIKPNALMLNGFSFATDTAPSFLSCFNSQKPQELEMLSVIPSSASNLLCFGVSNYARYFEKYRAYLQHIQRLKSHIDWVDAQNKSHEFDIEGAFAEMMGNEFGLFFLDNTDNQDLQQQKYILLKSANMNGAKAFFDKISSAVEVAGEESDKHIGKLDDPSLLQHFFGSNFGGFNALYYMELDPYIVFSGSVDNLRNMVEAGANKEVLSNDENFIHFTDNLSSESSILLYSNFSKAKSFYQYYTGETVNAILEKYGELLEKFEAVAIQLNAGKNGLFYQNAYCNYNPLLKKETKSLWETELDTALLTRPYVVLNHYTNAKEIVVQDRLNNVYLIDNKGNVLWKKKIDGPIISSIQQIDVYRNNKLQLLFNTEKQLHLLDRNGKEVTNYPVVLKEGASAGMTLVDYDKNRDYRILIPTNNRKLLNFSGTGERIEGWKFKKSKHIISRPVKYFSLKGKDYLIAVDDEGEVNVLDRKGEQRFKVKENLPISSGDFFIELHQDIQLSKLVAIDTVGNVVKLQFDNEKEIIPLTTVTGPTYFEYRDINNDKNYEYLLLNNHKLTVYNQQKNVMFEIPVESASCNAFMYFSSLGKYGKIGLLDEEEQKIYLYYDAGGIGVEFPLNGSTAFTIDDVNNDEVNDVMVGLGNAIVTYSLKR
jgi:hypothetical protein